MLSFLEGVVTKRDGGGDNGVGCYSRHYVLREMEIGVFLKVGCHFVLLVVVGFE